jgi:hypothetical protein
MRCVNNYTHQYIVEWRAKIADQVSAVQTLIQQQEIKLRLLVLTSN